MPKPATVLIGIVLVAGSIGLNIVRYPVVGEMLYKESFFALDSTSVNHAEEALLEKAQKDTTALSEAEPSALLPALAVAEQDGAIPLAEQPEELVHPSEQTAVESPQLATEAKTSRRVETSQKQPDRPINADSPLVPVARLLPIGQNDAASESDEVVRRLPPIEKDRLNPPAMFHRLPNGRWPSYPSTGLE